MLVSVGASIMTNLKDPCSINVGGFGNRLSRAGGGEGEGEGED